MKKIFFAAAALVAISTAANAADSGKSDFQGFYAGVMGAAYVVPGLDDTIFGGGITLGYNWNVSNGFIMGIEADALASSYKDVAVGDVSLRLRTGYDFDGFMVYGTAGVGGTGAAISFNDILVSTGVVGFVGGGGIEMMMTDHISLKAEGLYRGETEAFEFRTGINFNF